jgi:hypothetical protein
MSEGATVASMVDARSDNVEFVILVAAPTLRPRQVIDGQVVVGLKRQGKNRDETAARIELWDRIYDAIERGEPKWSVTIRAADWQPTPFRVGTTSRHGRRKWKLSGPTPIPACPRFAEGDGRRRFLDGGASWIIFEPENGNGAMDGRKTGGRRAEATGWAALCLAASVTFITCDGHNPTTPIAAYNEHEWIEETRFVGSVRGVVVSMPGHLRIDQGPDQNLWINGEMVLLPAIITQVRDGILEIRLEPGFFQHPGPLTEFVLSIPTLESAELADIGIIDCSELDVERLSLRLTDTGELDFPNLRASELEVTTAHNGGSVRISGRVNRQNIELPGIADYEARDLHSSQAHVTLSGSGSATVRVDDLLTVTITGSGSVYYLGDPEVESTITGSGQVVPIGS